MKKLPPGFEPVEDRSGWYRTATDHYATLEPRALKLHKQFPLPIQVVCGLMGDDDGHAIYVVENKSAVDLAKEFGVGSHNANPREGDRTDKVCDQLRRVFAVAAFRPYFVDAAGYKAQFLGRITSEQADAIEGMFINEDILGMEGYLSEWTGDGPILANTLVKENAIRLWWD